MPRKTASSPGARNSNRPFSTQSPSSENTSARAPGSPRRAASQPGSRRSPAARSSSAPEKAMRARSMGVRLRAMTGHARVHGLDIAYERHGQGPPLVLLHGALSDSRFWRRQLEGLAGEFTVVAWDEPGAGQSSDPPADFTLADFADCLAELIETLGLGARARGRAVLGRRGRAGALRARPTVRGVTHPGGHLRRLEGLAVRRRVRRPAGRRGTARDPAARRVRQGLPAGGAGRRRTGPPGRGAPRQ